MGRVKHKKNSEWMSGWKVEPFPLEDIEKISLMQWLNLDYEKKEDRLLCEEPLRLVSDILGEYKPLADTLTTKPRAATIADEIQPVQRLFRKTAEAFYHLSPIARRRIRDAREDPETSVALARALDRIQYDLDFLSKEMNFAMDRLSEEESRGAAPQDAHKLTINRLSQNFDRYYHDPLDTRTPEQVFEGKKNFIENALGIANLPIPSDLKALLFTH